MLRHTKSSDIGASRAG